MTKTIEVSYDLPGPPAKVWRALTEPKLLASWLVGHHFMCGCGSSTPASPKATRWRSLSEM